MTVGFKQQSFQNTVQIPVPSWSLREHWPQIQLNIEAVIEHKEPFINDMEVISSEDMTTIRTASSGWRSEYAGLRFLLAAWSLVFLKNHFAGLFFQKLCSILFAVSLLLLQSSSSPIIQSSFSMYNFCNISTSCLLVFTLILVISPFPFSWTKLLLANKAWMQVLHNACDCWGESPSNCVHHSQLLLHRLHQVMSGSTLFSQHGTNLQKLFRYFFSNWIFRFTYKMPTREVMKYCPK